MNAMFDLKSTQALWVLGLIPSDDLPDIATQALTQGIDSKSLLELSGLTGNEPQEARKLFTQALNELGCKDIEKADALKLYAKTISSLILALGITPLEGAKRIWQATLTARIEGFHDLDGFIYAASEMEDRPGDKALFETGIIEEARRWSHFEIQ